MSCCGQKRTTLKEFYNSKTSDKAKQSLGKQNLITFKYIGKDVLKLTGTISGKTYQFSVNNPFVKVLEPDASSMFGEPLLEKI
jgi:hypothetical protein